MIRTAPQSCNKYAGLRSPASSTMFASTTTRRSGRSGIFVGSGASGGRGVGGAGGGAGGGDASSDTSKRTGARGVARGRRVAQPEARLGLGIALQEIVEIFVV